MDFVVAVSSIDRVVSVFAPNLVSSAAGGDGVVASASVDAVVAEQVDERVITTAAPDLVVPRTAIDGRRDCELAADLQVIIAAESEDQDARDFAEVEREVIAAAITAAVRTAVAGDIRLNVNQKSVVMRAAVVNTIRTAV